MATVIYDDVNSDAQLETGRLFQGIKFWLSRKVPSRSRFINDIQTNGGEVLQLEKHADVKIVDHMKQEGIPGSHSYTFIESSLRRGQLEALDDHRAGPPNGTIRDVGSTVQPPKGTRNRYTQDDDRILWNWVHENPQKGGGTDGNEIYKQLQNLHPQHPWQSWRDRWVRQLKGKPCPFGVAHNAPPTPPSDSMSVTEAPRALQSSHATSEFAFGSFTRKDVESLMQFGDDILNIEPEKKEDAWRAWAQSSNDSRSHTWQEWQLYWEQYVRPRYLRRNDKQRAKTTTDTAYMNPHLNTHPNTHPNIDGNLKDPTTASQTKTLHRLHGGAEFTDMVKAASQDAAMASEQSANSLPHRGGQESTTPRKRLVLPDALSPDKQAGNRIPAAIDKSPKRKHVALEDGIPPTSLLGPTRSPKRNKNEEKTSLREVASTPDTSPARSGTRPDSPLFITSDDDENEEEGLGYENGIAGSTLGKQPSDTLSEPDLKTMDTQAILNGPTQSIDFEIPSPDLGRDDPDLPPREGTLQADFEVTPPEEGWNNSDDEDEISPENNLKITDLHPQSALQDTQAILRGKTPALDFDVVDPEGGWDHVIPSSPPPIASSPPGESEVSDVDARIESWINRQVDDGASFDTAVLVLKSVSMDMVLAEDVLKSMASDGELPRHRRGVWTESDDDDLHSTDARRILRLERKHGEECIAARWSFLSYYGAP